MTKPQSSSAWSLFLTLHANLIGAIERRLGDANLPPLTWYDALWALECAPEHRLRMHEFEQRMVISRSNVTRLIDRLETAGLVRRERSDEDRRGAFAVLTRKGGATRKRMWKIYERAIEDVFEAHLTTGELRDAEAIFRKLLDKHRAAVAATAR